MIDLIWFVAGVAVGAVAGAATWSVLRAWSSRHRVPNWFDTDPSVAPVYPRPPNAIAGAERDSEAVAPPQVAPRAEARLSERVLVQLAREGRLDPDAPVRPGRTQAGLAEAVESNRNAVSKVLRRLVAAGVVSEERRHVSGLSQRVKVYDLTRRGELLAREVARRRNQSLLPVRTPTPVDGRPETDRPPMLRAM